MKIENPEQLYKDLEIPQIPHVNLSRFIACQKRKPNRRIGVLKKEVPGLNSHKAGAFVLFTPYTPEECYGNMLWEEMKRHVKLCTMEVPSERFFKGESNIDTIGTIVGVPLSYIAYEILT